MNTCLTATRTDRGLSAAHTGTRLSAPNAGVATKRLTGIVPVQFVGVPAYVADQESHSPRGHSPD